MLHDRLSSDGYKVMMREGLIKKLDVDQQALELIMSANIQAQHNWINKLDKEGFDFLILDSYILSQLVFAITNGIDLEWTLEMQRFMRKPDIDIVIDIPAEESMIRRKKYNIEGNIRYESDLEMLKNKRENYILLPNEHSALVKLIVDGLLTVDELHEDIHNIVSDNIIHGDLNAWRLYDDN